MDTSYTVKKALIATTIIIVAIGAFLIHALAGLSAHPIVFAEPPAFVEQYAAKIGYSKLSSLPEKHEASGEQADESGSAKLTENFSYEEGLIHNVFFNDESSDLLLQLFAHQEKAQRVKIASAFAAVNVEFAHNEESGFPEKREQFWTDAGKHIPDIQNALFEALITSAEEGTMNYIPYTLAWMPGQGRETIALLAWAAEHHPHWWVRRFSVFFVVEYGQDEELAASLVKRRTHDPDYRVRKEALGLRFRRFTGEI